MTTRFSTVAGFLAAASLLSGSAFAFAPEFTSDLPTVIITDRLTQATQTGGQLLPFDDPDNVGGIGVVAPASAVAGRESTVYLFRYENALDLTTVIDTRDAASYSDVKVIFNEFLVGDTNPVANSDRTLELNGVRALDNIAPTNSDFSGPNAFSADAPVSFRNIDFSDPANSLIPSTEIYDAIGDVTGDNIELTAAQERLVTLQIDSLDSTAYEGSQLKSMLVITTTDGVDRLTNPFLSTILTSEIPLTSSFDGEWQVDFTSDGISGIANNGDTSSASPGDVPASGGVSGFTPDPASVAVTQNALGGIAPASTNQVGMVASNAQTGLSGWALLEANGGTVNMTADSVYRLRMTMAGQATQDTGLFFSFGSPFNTGKHYTIFLGGAVDGTSRTSPKLGAADQTVDIWAPARADGPGEVNLTIVDDSASGSSAFTLKDYQVDSVPRASLDSVATVLNQGASSLSATTAELAKAPLPASPDAILDQGAVADGSTWFDGETNIANGANQTPQSTTFSAAGYALSYGPVGSTYQDVWNLIQFSDAFGPGVDDIVTGYNLDPDSLYTFDVWLKAQTAGVFMPNLAIVAISDKSLQFASVYGIGDLGAIDNAEVQAQTTERVYSMAFNPATGNAEARTVFLLTFLGTVHTGFVQPMPQNTLTVSRMVLTEYVYPE